MFTVAELEELIERTRDVHKKFKEQANTGRRYYLNQNDILTERSPANTGEANQDSSLRRADNRVPNNFHQLLVDQKVAYTVTEPPRFAVDDDVINESIRNILGGCFPKITKQLATDASNVGFAWLHVWRGDEGFKYAVVDAVQLIAEYSQDLESELTSVLRMYQIEEVVYYEYWTVDRCYRFEGEEEHRNIIAIDDFPHEWGRVPFISFHNNNKNTNDLNMYKNHIDVYDTVYNGFANDVEDVQEVILILKGYGGTTLDELNEGIRRHKALNLGDASPDSGLDKLTIEIPVEARDKLLDITRKRIFEAGMGLDPLDERMGTSSGIALEYKYSLLEMKAALLEAEFREGFANLISFILTFLNHNTTSEVEQKWTRTAIRNNIEQSQIIANLANVTSKQNVAKANPLVDDYLEELELLKQERLDEVRMEDDYNE